MASNAAPNSSNSVDDIMSYFAVASQHEAADSDGDGEHVLTIRQNTYASNLSPPGYTPFMTFRSKLQLRDFMEMAVEHKRVYMRRNGYEPVPGHILYVLERAKAELPGVDITAEEIDHLRARGSKKDGYKTMDFKLGKAVTSNMWIDFLQLGASMAQIKSITSRAQAIQALKLLHDKRTQDDDFAVEHPLLWPSSLEASSTSSPGSSSQANVQPNTPSPSTGVRRRRNSNTVLVDDDGSEDEAMDDPTPENHSTPPTTRRRTGAYRH
eukprot:scaffold167289_cov21-Prasinocladus_malaysianus.AAC.2